MTAGAQTNERKLQICALSKMCMWVLNFAPRPKSKRMKIKLQLSRRTVRRLICLADIRGEREKKKLYIKFMYED